MEPKTNFFGIKEMTQNPLDNLVKENLSMLLFAYPWMTLEDVADISIKCITFEGAQNHSTDIIEKIKTSPEDWLKRELSKKFYLWMKVYEMPELSDVLKLSAFLNMESSELIRIFYKGIRLFMKEEMPVYLKLCSVIFEKYKQIMSVNQFMEMLNIQVKLDKEIVEAFSLQPLDKTLLMGIIRERTMQQKNFFGIRALQNKPLDDRLKQKLSGLLFLHPDFRRETNVNNVINNVKESDMAETIERLEKEITGMGKEYLTSMLANKVPTWFYLHSLPAYEELLEVAVFLETDVLHWVTGFKYNMSRYYSKNDIRRLEILHYAPLFTEKNMNEILDEYLDNPKPENKRLRLKRAKNMSVKTD